MKIVPDELEIIGVIGDIYIRINGELIAASIARSKDSPLNS